MGETVPIKYRAFLSYSHKDTSWAKWLHGRLEGFRIDRDLVGRETPLGPVPKTLRPIFRDRDDFSGGHTLTEATMAALDASAALIVLCSMVSATRPAVNEEVRLFRSRQPDRPVIPVIIDGSWPENFPPALRYELGADGTITDRPVTILGPDLRESGDGKNLGLAKAVAGLTGLSPDDVYRRAERERRRQGRLRAGVAAVVVALAGVGAVFFWQSHEQKQTLAEITALVEKYSLAGPAQAATPGARESLTQAITAIAEGAATDPRYAKALELLKEGKPAEAEPLLKAVAEDKAKRADKDAKDAATAYRNLASIATVSDRGRAREYYAEAARLDPTDLWGMLQNGWFQELADEHDAAQAAFSRVIAAAKSGPDDEALLWAQLGTGNLQRERGDLSAGLASYQTSLAIADRRAQMDPGNADWQRALWVSYEMIGSVQFAQGDLAGALQSYRNTLATTERLAQSDPSNTGWQNDLTVSYQGIGDVQTAQGDLVGAQKSYSDSVAIAERLARSDPGNVGWERLLSVSYERIGNTQVAQRDLAGALKSYTDSLTITERLAQSDPSNASSQLDWSVSYNDVGNVEVAQGDLASALKSYRSSLAIRERLAKSDPNNGGWQRDLAVSYERIGSAQVAQGDLSGALKSYRDSVAVIEPLAQSNPSNFGWQRDLSVVYTSVGDVQVKQGDLAGALKSYGDTLMVRERLAQSDPGNVGWQRDLSVAYENVGEVQVAQGDLAGALKSYRDELPIAERLAQSDPSNAQWQRDFAVSYSHLVSVFTKMGDKAQALDASQKGRDIMERLVKLSRDNAGWQSDLAWFDAQIANLSQ